MGLASRKNFHLPLSADLHQRLHEAASRLGRPATEIAREGIEELLLAQERAELAVAMRSYAAAVAGTADDLDPALEQAAVAHLVGTKGRRR